MIIGAKTYLKVIERENIETMRSWRNNPELRKNFREWRELSEMDQEKWFSTRVNNNDNWVGLEIHSKADITDGPKKDQLIGYAGLQYINWLLRSSEFGIYIANYQPFRGHRLGTDALNTLIRYGFEELGLHKIWCEVFEFNSAIHVYEGMGFKRDGVLRDSCFKGGKYWNSIVLSLLDSEYQNRSNEHA